MPAQQQQFYNFAAGAVSSPNAVETVVGTTAKVNSSYAGCTFAILFILEFAVGAAATSVTFAIRRQSLTGTSVLSTGLLAVVAAATAAYPLAATDQQVGEIASGVYVLTANVAGGAAAGSATNVFSTVVVAE